MNKLTEGHFLYYCDFCNQKNIKENKLVISPEQLELIKAKETIWYEENSLYPEQRFKKYNDRGWKIRRY